MVTDFGLLLQPVVLVLETPFLGAMAALALGSLDRRLAGWVSVVAAGITLLLALVLLGQAPLRPASFLSPLSWWPLSPAPPTFYADSVATGLVALVAGVSLCLLASSCDRATLPRLGRGYFPLALSTVGTSIALFLSHDLLTFYTCWELGTIFAALTLLTRFDNASATAAARFMFSSLLLSAFIFFAIVWTGLIAGSFHFSALGLMANQRSPEIHWLLPGALVAAALFRSAILPFHVWMNKALQAAHPQVAALLYVALPSAGFYAMIRLVLPYFPLNVEWRTVIAALGLLTALSGAAAALRPKEPSSVLAYICIGQAGFVAVGLGVGTPLGVAAATFQLFAFAVSVTLLSLIITNHSLLLGQTNGWRWEFGAVAIAVLSVAGLPSLSGYGARTLLLESLMQGGSITHQILLAGVLLATAMGLAAVARLMLGLLAHHQLTVGAEPNLPETGHSLAAPDVPTQAHVAHNLPGNGNRASWWNRAPIFTLAAASVILGIPSHWLSTGFFTRFAVDSLGVPLSAVQTATPSWTYPVSTVLLFASFGLGVLIHVARSDSATVAAVPSLAAVRGFASRLSLLSPLTSRYWQLVDKGAFDFYPAISTFLGGFARIAAFVVYVSAGRSAR